ncbi:amylo-alpha-1,6-glucosidase [Nocardia sp. 852002-20019_SCH5090214]|uniref:Amylo-alpha-1,6-glucosidase n=1 Tax=Nocardia nova TaxID=37330 RepID=A0A2S6A776_9NOCA|nr:MULTISPECIES: glycogen debranching N-terminal domain-containing protein [Nocardia]MBF6144832.1 amylo-alpha-1,6-glucosidase [Nocardia nova]MBV7702531.1 amylo-alpha-1,6-glucosidase [Nocardia nova]MDN2497522.1 amylo-alpha-1,6-glucosidase [Nocardia nova]OBA53254.1 amylo-alpha-1,6-glucosidase [Nocardia sp. 852002-20019_SCH5090214]PPJ11397.1 amylo-alpha-1,6-glucosidase [Nocardia nova]
MTGPSPLNGGEPALLNGSVTLVEGSTFCLSDRVGDVESGTSQGLFYRDARVVSRWELRVDGQRLEPLSVLSPEAFTARFILRRPPRSGAADSSLLVVRERLVADGMRETVILENLGREPTAVVLELRADADFVDLFAVKEGRAGHGRAEILVTDNELLLNDRSDRARGLAVSSSELPTVLPGSLTWRIVVPATGRWQTEILAQPTVANQRVHVALRPGEHYRSSEPGRKMAAWRDTATKLTTGDPQLTAILQRTESDLGALQIREERRHRTFVAAGAPWFMTLFGRDSLLTAWMALPLDSSLALGTMQQLAEMQGQQVDALTEEEPGRIMHEIRRGPAGGLALGGEVYYGTVDATPLFVMLLAETRRWGASPEAVQTLLPAADAALDWMSHFGDRDGDGFVEYQRATDRGLINQGWKDSFDGINDAAGHLAQAPIALCEVQSYVYAAILARAELAEEFGQSDKAEKLREHAAELRTKFAEAFWIPEKGWYAVALDGNKRRVDALTSNVGHCLWSGIVTDDHAEQLVHHLATAEMDSGFGLRTLSSGMGAFNPMSYHNGSVWPHDTAIAVAGLLRYRHIPGAVGLATRLSNGLLDAATAFGGRLPELFCGFQRSRFSAPVPYPTSCSPQAWASAAPLLLVRSFLGLEPDVPHRTVTVLPHVPARWGRVELTDLRLGGTAVDLAVDGEQVTAANLPEDWRLITH